MAVVGVRIWTIIFLFLSICLLHFFSLGLSLFPLRLSRYIFWYVYSMNFDPLIKYTKIFAFIFYLSVSVFLIALPCLFLY